MVASSSRPRVATTRLNARTLDQTVIFYIEKDFCVNVIALSHGTFSGYPGKVAGALQIDAFQMIKAFCKPRIKVGTEWVSEHYCEHYYQII